MIISEETLLWKILTQIMQLMLGTAEKCDELEVRHHINIQQRGQEQIHEQSIWQELLYLI